MTTLVFWLARKTKLFEDVEILFPFKFRWILFDGFKLQVQNISVNPKPGRLSWFSDRPENTNLVDDIWILLPVRFCWIPFSSCFRDEDKMSRPIRGQGGNLISRSARKNTHLVDYVAIVRTVKFRIILFRCKRIRRKCLSQSETILFFRQHKRDRGRWVFTSYQVS